MLFNNEISEFVARNHKKNENGFLFNIILLMWFEWYFRGYISSPFQTIAFDIKKLHVLSIVFLYNAFVHRIFCTPPLKFPKSKKNSWKSSRSSEHVSLKYFLTKIIQTIFQQLKSRKSPLNSQALDRNVVK